MEGGIRERAGLVSARRRGGGGFELEERDGRMLRGDGVRGGSLAFESMDGWMQSWEMCV